MDKKLRPSETTPDAVPERPAGLRWYWYYGAQGWAWAYHTIFRSMQLESNSETAIGEASAVGESLSSKPDSPTGKRKRDASP